ncbi:MAG: efflux RND transporter periplasmic adaptor subunit [Clostridia bacterium]|nr:efflux RND transporter periplasmic adaptor subunit [Clostridia bacterium]
MSIFKKKSNDAESTASEIRIKKSSKKKKIIIIIAILIVVIAFFFFRGSDEESQNTVKVTRANVTRGSINVTLTGSGTIEANEQREITSLVKGDITADFFEENDIVKKDQPLYQIDVSDMETSIQRAQDNVSKAQRTYNKNMEDLGKLTVKSPVSGVISDVQVSKGDSVGNGTPLLTIQDNSKMILTIEFNESDRSKLYVGANAQVNLESSSTTYSGIVERVASGSIINSRNVSVIVVEIAVYGSNNLTPGTTATAIVNGVACNSAGTFTYNEVKIVKSEIQGDVKSINYKKGDLVQKGHVLVNLESETLDDAIFNSRMALQDAQLSLKNLEDTKGDYTIKSPIDGTVIYKNSKAGDKLDNTTASTSMAIIADMSVIKFTLAVDELDITKVQLNQRATITADALSGKRFDGYVSEISSVGTTTNGVTTYPVTIVIDNPEGLIPGMNVEANIITQSAENVLLIPATALNRGNTVWVKETSASAKNGKIVEAGKNLKNPELYKGYVQVQVEPGLSTSAMTEIKSGLSEGDEILITTVIAEGSFNPMDMMNGHPGMGTPPSGAGNRPSGMGGAGNRPSGTSGTGGGMR